MNDDSKQPPYDPNTDPHLNFDMWKPCPYCGHLAPPCDFKNCPQRTKKADSLDAGTVKS